MKTLHANKDYVLHNGNIHILKNEVSFFATWNTGDIIASTDKSLPVKYIDRSFFVKPVDVEELAVKQLFGNLNEIFPNQVQAIRDFEAGYNANPNQFTLEQLQNAICAAHHLGTQGEIFEITEKIVLEKLMPLALPETIQCDDNYENLIPIWK